MAISSAQANLQALSAALNANDLKSDASTRNRSDMKMLMEMIDELLMKALTKMLMQQLSPQDGSNANHGFGESGGHSHGHGATKAVTAGGSPAATSRTLPADATQQVGSASGAPIDPPPASKAAAAVLAAGGAPAVPAAAAGAASAGQARGASPTAGPPAGKYINAADYGVVGDGKTDNTAALQKALDAGKASGQPVYLGAGTYAHGGPLTLDGVKLNGAGESTVLKATNPDQSAITLTGNGASLSNVKASVDGAPGRSSQPNAAAVLVQNSSNANVSNVVTQGAASNGIRLDNAQGSTITGNLVQGSNADGIALMNGSSNNKIGKNVVYQAGDDSFSDDSYTSDARQDTGNVFDGNAALDGKYGRGFALMGSTGDTLTNNVVNGVSGVGIASGQDANSGTMVGGGNTISGNRVSNEFDANSGNGTPTTPEAVKAGLNSAGIAAVLGWTATLVDKSTYNSAYTAGTGAGSSNSGGIRT